MADALTQQIEAAACAGAAKALEERDQGMLHQVLSALAEQQAGSDLQLWEPYTVKEVARILRLSPSRVYDIPEDQLVPTWVGPSKGSKRFLGINVLAYITSIEPVDVQAVAGAVRERFMRDAREPVKVKHLGEAPGRKRVL